MVFFSLNTGICLQAQHSAGEESHSSELRLLLSEQGVLTPAPAEAMGFS